MDVPVPKDREPVPDWAKNMDPPGAPGGMSGEKISPPQRKYLLSLIEKRAVKPEDEGKLDLVMKCLRISEDPEEYGMSKAKASELIDWFLTRPYKPRSEQPQRAPAMWGSYPDILAGRYAVDSNEGELRFYQVWRPRDNPGVFRLYVLHGPDSSPVHFNAANAIMAKIAADPRAAAIRFGKEIGECSACGRRLTNRISRELAIGPICGGRFWEKDEWKAMKAKARQDIIDRGEDPDEELE